MKYDVNLIEDAQRAAYSEEKAKSDEARVKGIHFYNEQRGDKTSALGRIRKYTRKKPDSVMVSLLGRSSGLALLVADTIGISSQRVSNLFKTISNKIQSSSNTTIDTNKNSLSDEFAHQVIVVNDDIYTALENHMRLEDEVNALKRENLSKGLFMGPLQESFAEALSQYEGQDLNDPLVQQALKATINMHTHNIVRESGIYKLNGVFVVPASQMATFQETFRDSASSAMHVVHVYGDPQNTASKPAAATATQSATPRLEPLSAN